MGLEISYSNGFVLDKNLEVKLNKAFEVISAEEDLSQYSINIRIVNDKEMIDLNRKFRKKTHQLMFYLLQIMTFLNL